MHIRVNDCRLYFDIDGAGLVAEGPEMQARPTLLLIHGGPGADHSIYKPEFQALTDVAQVIWMDLRGNGRSEEGPQDTWCLSQWADDIAAFLDVLGIERPVVYGASFGGVVAQAFATTYPDKLSGLILSSTCAKTDFDVIYKAFGQLGGPEAEDVARTYWSDPTPERRQRYFETCLPLYSVTPTPPDVMSRMIVKAPVAMHYNGPDNEQGRFDFRTALARVTVPTLLISGDKDPIMPRSFMNEIATCLTGTWPQHERLKDCGHMTTLDQPEAVLSAIRTFLTSSVSP